MYLQYTLKMLSKPIDNFTIKFVFLCHFLHENIDIKTKRFIYQHAKVC